MEINFFGLAETTRVFIPILKKGTKAAIVNISSVSGKRGIPAQSEYSASKFAVQGFSEALRAELAKDAIDVLVVNPGLTNTDFPKNMIEQTSRQNLGTMRTDTPESVADRTLVALEKGKDEITLTRLGKFIVLMNRLFPSMANRIAKKRVLKLYKDEIEARKKEESK
jgi:short-subunit dehydrogenase